MIVVAFILPIMVACLALCVWWPSGGSWRDDIITKLSLAGPLGIGGSSVLYFLWSLLFTPSGRTMVLVETTLFVGLAAFLVFRLMKRARASGHPLTPANRLGWFTAGFGVCMALGTIQFLNILVRTPHGHWDAWAIWNLRARFLFRSAEHWDNAFSELLYWSSPDYPLGLPAAIANGWKFVGSETVAVPMVIAAIIFACTFGLLWSTVSKLSGRFAAIVAGLCLVGTPLFLKHAASQYADVMLACFVLATVACLVRYDSRETRERGWLVLAGLMAAMAAWTKNEGVLFLVAIVIGRGWLAFRGRSLKTLAGELGRMLLGAAPVLIVLAVFKLTLAPPSGLFAAQGFGDMAAKLTDWSRYAEVGSSFFKQMALYGEGMAIAMVLFGVLTSARRSVWKANGVIGAALVLIVMLFGYFCIYLITPENLAWHLSTSIHRLLLQLWPLTILIFALIIRPPAPATPTV